jgi:hypothetical protein
MGPGAQNMKTGHDAKENKNRGWEGCGNFVTKLWKFLYKKLINL